MGALIAVQGDTVTTDVTSGTHLCDSTTTIAGGSSTVFAGGVAVARDDDALAAHTYRVGESCVPCISFVESGSSTVFANGKAIARLGDAADANGGMGQITSCSSSNIFVGG